MADPETEDWTQITEPRLRKRVQNRLSQRKHSESPPFLTGIPSSLASIYRKERMKSNTQSQGQSLRQQRKESLEVAPPSSQTPNTRPGNTVPRLAASNSHPDADEWNSQRSNLEHAKPYIATPRTLDFDRWDGIDSFSPEILEAPDLATLSGDASSQISSWPASSNINPQPRRHVDRPSSIMAEPESFLPPPPPPPPSPALAQMEPKMLARRAKNSFPAPATAPPPVPAPASASAPAPAPAQWTLADMHEFDSVPRSHPPPLTCNPSTLSNSATMTSAAAGYGLDPRLHQRYRPGVQVSPRRSSNHLDNVMQSPHGVPPSSSSPMYINMLSDADRRGPEQYESLRLGSHGMLRI